MRHLFQWLASMILVLCLPTVLWSAPRVVPDEPATICLKASFNGETIKAYAVMIDARTEAEKEADAARGQVSGSVLVFLQGHGQRPADAYKFTSKLALQSRSGIVVIPVCDTPYGTDKAWRADRGKDVILMEMVRALLGARGIAVEGYRPLTDQPVAIQGIDAPASATPVKAPLAVIGWSHGGILARRFANVYPASVTALGQVCPAGYKAWANSAHLCARFAWEGLHIGTLIFRGHAVDTLGCSWGLTKGVVGDFCRSIPPAKLGRSCRDIRECILYCDDKNLPLPDIRAVVVVFGRDDTCMDPEEYGIKDKTAITPDEDAAFWRTYYPGAQAGGAHLELKVLPGTHIGPVSHSEQYASAILKGLDQLEPAPQP